MPFARAISAIFVHHAKMEGKFQTGDDVGAPYFHSDLADTKTSGDLPVQQPGQDKREDIALTIDVQVTRTIAQATPFGRRVISLMQERRRSLAEVAIPAGLEPAV